MVETPVSAVDALSVSSNLCERRKPDSQGGSGVGPLSPILSIFGATSPVPSPMPALGCLLTGTSTSALAFPTHPLKGHS